MQIQESIQPNILHCDSTWGDDCIDIKNLYRKTADKTIGQLLRILRRGTQEAGDASKHGMQASTLAILYSKQSARRKRIDALEVEIFFVTRGKRPSHTDSSKFGRMERSNREAINSQKEKHQ
jgi:hypothetical protein